MKNSFIFSIFTFVLINASAQNTVYQSLDTINNEYIIYHDVEFSGCPTNNLTFENILTKTINNELHIYGNQTLGVSLGISCLIKDTLETSIQVGSNIDFFVTHTNFVDPFNSDTTFDINIDTLSINQLSIQQFDFGQSVSLINPVQEDLNFIMNEEFENPTKMEIFDLSGRKLHQQIFENNMDVTFLNKGIYFVYLINKEQRVGVQFYKE